MAYRVDIDIVANDLASRALEGVLAKLGGVKDIAAAGAIAGLGTAYLNFLKDTIQPAAEAETANIRLAAALRATGRDSETSAPQLAVMAEQLMKMSTFDDESIKGAFQALAQFPSIPTGAFESLTLAAMDLTAATGGDLQSNIEGIGRALETGIIPRSWGFSAALKEQFAAQVAAGDSAGALMLMLDQLQLRYGGQAAAEVGTYAGQVKQLKNNWNEFQEAIGAEFIPALSDLLGWVNRNFEAVTAWTGAIIGIMQPALALSNLMKDIVQGNVGGIQNYQGGSLYVPPGTKPPTGGGGPVVNWGNLPGGFRAGGGPVSAGGAYVVGEYGPELFVPGRSGNIVPGGGVTVQVNYSPMFSSASPADVERMMPVIEQGVRRALRNIQ